MYRLLVVLQYVGLYFACEVFVIVFSCHEIHKALSHVLCDKHMDSVILFEVIPPVALSCVIIATKPVGGIKIGEIEYYVYIVSNSGSCAWVLDRYFQYVRFPYFSFEIFSHCYPSLL